MRLFACLPLALCLCLASWAQEKAAFQTDPTSPELKALARPLEIDESKYGCGPLVEPGRTYYYRLEEVDSAGDITVLYTQGQAQGLTAVTQGAGINPSEEGEGGKGENGGGCFISSLKTGI